MDEIKLIKKKLERERAARKAAEEILEAKALELFGANESLRQLNESLEIEIAKRTESLSKSEERYRNLVEQAGDVIYNIDHRGVFLYINQTGISRFGYSSNDIVGRRFSEFIPPEDRSQELKYYAEIIQSRKKSDYHEFRILSKSGEISWFGQNVNRVELDEGAFYFTVVAREITKRKLAEVELSEARLQLQKSEIKYRSIIENMELGLLEVDNNGNISRVYDRFCQMLGYESEELIGRNANATLLVEGYEDVLNQEDSKRKEGQTSVYEVKLKKKDGSEIYVIISGAPFYDVNGNVIGSIGVHYDITDRKELQEQLEIAKRKAVKAQQAEKIFLANMSHEIRTPLNVLIGMSHLLSDTELDANQQELLEVLSDSASILKNLIADILDISKIDSGSIEVQQKTFDPVELANKLISTFSKQDRDGKVDFMLETDPQLTYPVLGDPQLINQVLINLLSNAQKFTERGSIVLRLKVLEDIKDHIHLQFSVADTGIGIPKDEMLSIFNEFKQASSEIRMKYGGTGLGLSISYQLVKLMGGELVVDSQIGEGSTFSFVLQLQKGDHNDLKNHVERRLDVIDKTHHILIVEDHKMNGKYITSLLKKWKLNYHLCRNGQEAVDVCQNQIFDIIFMDLQMPIMGGFEATRIIRSTENLNTTTPIIALTASTFLSKKRLALKAGMTDFLSKPFSPDQLYDMLVLHLQYSKHDTELESEYVFSEELDRSYLDEAYGSDIDYALDMFATFIDVIDDDLILARDHIATSDLTALKNHLHRIKPSFTMVGLAELTRRIEHIEDALRTCSQEELELWYDDFENRYKVLQPFILEEIKNMKTWLDN